jgi:acetylornithine aminotransferase
MRIMKEDHLLENAAQMGDYLRSKLQQAFSNLKGFQEVRGKGLMIGVVLDRPCSAIMQKALDAGLLLSVTADSVIRLVPALTITREECDEIVHRLTPVVQSFLSENP